MHHEPRIRAVLSCCLGLVLCQAGAVAASSFKITPVQVALSGRTRSALLTLSNESDEALRFEVSAFTWDQSAKGEMVLHPTQDILFFPALFTVAPGKEQKIRVGTSVGAGSEEKTYRIFVQELRPLATSTPAPGTTQVRILTRMGIPIFLEPAKAHLSGVISGARVSGGVLSFDVRNTGNVHFSVLEAKVVGRAADGTEVFEQRAEGWYVLAQGLRTYEIPLTADRCSRAARVAVEVRTGFGTLTGETPIAERDCAVAKPAPTAKGGVLGSTGR